MPTTRYFDKDGNFVPEAHPGVVRRTTSDDHNPRAFSQEFKCKGCGEWLTEEEVNWALENGKLDVMNGSPWCDSCLPAEKFPMTLEEAKAKTGWDEDSIIAVMFDFIHVERNLGEEFKAYLGKRVGEEIHCGNSEA